MNHRNQILILLLIVVSGLLLIASEGYLSRTQPDAPGGERDLYLPEVNYLKFISLGNNELIADLVLAKTLTYFGSHYRQRDTFQFRHLKKLFFTAIEMDPKNTDAILMAGNILSDINVRDAIEVLELGMRYHPNHWKFPEMIGFHYFFRLNDPFNAGNYYEIASRMPGHPPYIPSLSGKFYQESGRYEEAIRVLYNFYSTTADQRLKKSFAQSIQQLKEKLESRDFLLKATVLNVIRPTLIEVQPDLDNPQFQSLRSKETLHIKSVNSSYSMDSGNPSEKMFARFHLDYARFALAGEKISIAFEREPDGGLKRDHVQRLWGTITLKNDTPYQLPQIPGFPPPAIDLDPAKVHTHIGTVVSLRYTLHQVESTGTAIYLHSASPYRNRFSAVIPLTSARALSRPGTTGSDPRDIADYFHQWQGKQVTVSGLVLIRQRRIIMPIYFPPQLQ
ncbi:MAG: hypothetical protein GY940_47640 [bacterium]|nr:hypothetical protein [bacterium]